MLIEKSFHPKFPIPVFWALPRLDAIQYTSHAENVMFNNRIFVDVFDQNIFDTGLNVEMSTKNVCKCLLLIQSTTNAQLHFSYN